MDGQQSSLNNFTRIREIKLEIYKFQDEKKEEIENNNIIFDNIKDSSSKSTVKYNPVRLIHFFRQKSLIKKTVLRNGRPKVFLK